MHRVLCVLCLGLAVTLLSHVPPDFLGSSGAPEVQPGIAAKPIALFTVEGLPMVDALLRLAQEQHIPLGIEYVDARALHDPISVEVRRGTVAQALDTILKQAKGYEWTLADGVVVITHVSVPSQSRSNLLRRTLGEFTIPKCTIAEASNLLRMALEQDLRPTVRGWVGNYNPGVGTRQIGPLTTHKATVRQILNRFVREHGNAAWVVHVPPGNLSQLPSQGLWTIIEYESPPRLYSQVLEQMLLTFRPTAPDKKPKK